MSIKGNLSLPELAAKYHIKNIYGAYLAFFTSKEGGLSDLRMVDDRISCYEFQLIKKGVAHIHTGGQQYELHEGDLLALTPYQSVSCYFPPDVQSDGLLVEQNFYESIVASCFDTDTTLFNLPTCSNCVYHLDEGRMEEFVMLLRQLRFAISRSHIKKVNIIRSLMNVFLLTVSELPYEERLVTRDFKHKEDLLKLFFFLAKRNFKKEHQIQFYADKLSITTTYLSRVARELTGNSINHHLTKMIFEESCNLLRSTDMTIGEIADHLYFNDTSAFTNFFKLHSKTSPREYRKRHL